MPTWNTCQTPLPHQPVSLHPPLPQGQTPPLLVVPDPDTQGEIVHPGTGHPASRPPLLPQGTEGLLGKAVSKVVVSEKGEQEVVARVSEYSNIIQSPPTFIFFSYHMLIRNSSKSTARFIIGQKSKHWCKLASKRVLNVLFYDRSNTLYS